MALLSPFLKLQIYVFCLYYTIMYILKVSGREHNGASEGNTAT